MLYFTPRHREPLRVVALALWLTACGPGMKNRVRTKKRIADGPWALGLGPWALGSGVGPMGSRARVVVVSRRAQSSGNT